MIEAFDRGDTLHHNYPQYLSTLSGALTPFLWDIFSHNSCIRKLLTLFNSGEICHLNAVNKNCPSSPECDSCAFQMYVHVFGAGHCTV